MLGAASAQWGRPRRCTWANINILHKEPLKCRGQSPGSAPLGGLGSPHRVCRVNRRVGRYGRADGSDSRPDMKGFWGQRICIHIGRVSRCVWRCDLGENNTVSDLLITFKWQNCVFDWKTLKTTRMTVLRQWCLVTKAVVGAGILSPDPPWSAVESS